MLESHGDTMRRNTLLSNTAQAFTLEGIISGLLIVSVGLIFALKVTAITPLSASTSSQHIENQQAEIAQGVLESAERETLVQTVLYWNNSSEKFHDSDPDGEYRVNPPDTVFGERLEKRLLDNGIGANVELVYYQNESSFAEDKYTLFTTGSPSDHAFTVTRKVPIYESDVLYDDAGNPTNTTVTNSSLYVDNINEDTELYNVIIVRLTVWRI